MTEQTPATPAGSVARLLARNVSKTFGQNTVLTSLGLDIAPGEVHALVGHNGSGKSTFVKVLSGFYQPDHGALGWTNGEAFTLGDARSAAAAGLRFVHQDLGLVETLDSVDNLFLDTPFPLARGRRIDWAAARTITRDLLDSLGFDFDVTLPVQSLSPTQRTALAIARAIRPGAVPTRVVVLDEPTAALPARDTETLFRVIRALQGQGLGVLFISHHLEEVFGLGGRVSVLRDGRLVGTYAVAELDEASLIELMVGDLANSDQKSADRSDSRIGKSVLAVTGLATALIGGIDFDVRAGEVLGVAGVDGSGREELAMALHGGIGRSGDVSVEGRRLPEGRPDLAVLRGIGLVPADRAVDASLSDMSVTSNLTIARMRTRLWRLLINHRAEVAEAWAWTTRLKIRPPRPETPMAELSGGNAQKVIFARWLRTAPKVLILDEPTKGVDVLAVVAIWDLILDAASTGTAVVVCSSDTEELVAHCHRVLVMRRGRVAAVAEGERLQSSFVDAVALSSTT